MTNLEVGQNLLSLNSTLTNVVLRSAKIAGTLAIQGPRREGSVCGNASELPPQSADFTGATIGTLSLGSVCYGPIDAPKNWGADIGVRPEDPPIAEVLKPLGCATGQFGETHVDDNDEFLSPLLAQTKGTLRES